MSNLEPQTPALMPHVGDVVAEKYFLERVIGRGGMGTVFAARHLFTEKRCALKWIKPGEESDAARKRFEQEARAAGRVHHPNVIAVYDVGQHGGASFLVMELLEGQSLRERLLLRPLPLTCAIDFVAQAARGVAAAHQAGVVHRDLKPDNLFITLGTRKQSIVKVLDFGISKIANDPSSASVTRSGALVGTPLYMAPERLFGEASDERADIYSLGVILYECLTGQVPFVADNAAVLGRRFVERVPVTPPSVLRPDVFPLIDEVVEHALRLDKTERPRSASSFADKLEEVLALLPELAQEGSSSDRPLASAKQAHTAPLVVETTLPDVSSLAVTPATSAATTTHGKSASRRHSSLGRPRRRIVLASLAIASTAILGWGLSTRAPVSKPLQRVSSTAAPSAKERVQRPSSHVEQTQAKMAEPPLYPALSDRPDAGIVNAVPPEPTTGAAAVRAKLSSARKSSQRAPDDRMRPVHAQPARENPSAPEGAERLGRSKQVFDSDDFYGPNADENATR